MLDDRMRDRVYVGGIIKATVVCDGRVLGIWRLDRSSRSATVRVSPFEPFTRAHHDGLDRERADIERFLGRPVALEVESGLLVSIGGMRAIVYSEKGPSSVLSLVERPAPEPGPGQVRVRLVRAGVNPTDWKTRAGVSSSSMAFTEITPGQDGAGFVDSLGAGAPGLTIGDRVWLYLGQHGLPYGTAAEYTVLDARHVVRLPDSLPDDVAFDLGASLGVPAITAHRALTCGTRTSRLGPGSMTGQVVLVQGGAGAVGNAAIQLAVWSGATVITTISSDAKAALATAAGAQHVVNYRTTDAAAAIRAIAPDGVDLIAEVSPARNNDLDVAVARNGATIAIYANNGGDTFPIDVRRTFSTNLRYQFLLLYTLDQELLGAAAEEVNEAVAAGTLRVGEKAGLPLHHFPLAETPAAYDAVEHDAVGKVLIDISRPV
jgi:NADPH2:quinone reductase